MAQEEEDQSEENFDQFQRLTHKLLKVPKKEVDDLRRTQQEKKQEDTTESNTASKT